MALGFLATEPLKGAVQHRDCPSHFEESRGGNFILWFQTVPLLRFREIQRDHAWWSALADHKVCETTQYESAEAPFLRPHIAQPFAAQKMGEKSLCEVLRFVARMPLPPKERITRVPVTLT